MNIGSFIQGETGRPKPWWREIEVLWLIGLVVVAYFLRAGQLPLRGEEPTRAQIALEMVHGHDWLVPREQGEPFRVRPPLQSWVIATTCAACGSWNELAVRFPSLCCTLLTTLVIYGYCRTFLSRLGALAASTAFATLADMFQMGRQAETEAIFILLVSSSLLVWHWLLLRRGPVFLTYAAGYGLMALAMLTKGIQAPAYFIGSIWVYLLLTGQWRRLFCKAHLLGCLVGAAIILAWFIPYSLTLGWPRAIKVWLGDPAVTYNSRFRAWNPMETCTHLVRYPLEIAAGTLPWSLLLLAYGLRDLRRLVRTAYPQALFAVICLAVAFPSCWIPVGGLPRYFAPLFPCLAILIGLALQQCGEAVQASPLGAAWRRFLLVVGCTMVAAAAALFVPAVLAGRFAVLAPWVEPLPTLICYAAASVTLAWLIFHARRTGGVNQARLGVMALAAFLVLTFSGIVTNVRVRRSEDPATTMRLLKAKLPPGQHLVSLGRHTDSLFAYYYGTPILGCRPLPAQTADLDPDAEYFCVTCEGAQRPQLPFAWEEVGFLPLDRNRLPTPERVVVIGRRLLHASLAAAGTKSSSDKTKTMVR